MIYLDNNATTRASAKVIAEVTKYLDICYSNASASSAAYTGADVPRREAARLMQEVLKAEEPEAFYFTSGATESNNWIFSSVASTEATGEIYISSIEHPSVRDSADRLQKIGFDLIQLPVHPNGVICLDSLARKLSSKTRLVSVMAANNETGVIQPIEEVGRLIRSKCPSAIFHTDATQAIGRISIDLEDHWSSVDLLSFSAHKFHGPKGIGGVYCRPGLKLQPLLAGGGQEEGLRSGTTNTPGLAGLAAAASEIDVDAYRQVGEKRNYFERRLVEMLPAVIHSFDAPRLVNTSCFSIPGISGDDLALSLAELGIIVGTGSACSSGSLTPPNTLLAMGVDYRLAAGTLRVSLSEATTFQELEVLLEAIVMQTQKS